MQILKSIKACLKSNAEFLSYNGLTARIEETIPKSFFSDAIIDYAYSHYRNMLPIHRWLKKVLD